MIIGISKKVYLHIALEALSLMACCESNQFEVKRFSLKLASFNIIHELLRPTSNFIMYTTGIILYRLKVFHIGTLYEAQVPYTS